MTPATDVEAPNAGPRIAVVQHEDDCPLGLFDGWLRAAGARIEIVRPDRGDPLPAPGGGAGADGPPDGPPDGLIVLGGSAAATDDDRWPWLPATRRMLRGAVDAGVPTLGICLGHQLLAVACGGRVEPNPAGKQMSVLPVGHRTAERSERLFAGRVRRGGGGAVHWNDDIVVELPADATLLAVAPGGVPQAMRVGQAAWGVQFHPEADERIVAAWARSEGPVTPAKRAALAEIAAARDDLVATWRPLAARFVEIAAQRRSR